MPRTADCGLTGIGKVGRFRFGMYPDATIGWRLSSDIFPCIGLQVVQIGFHFLNDPTPYGNSRTMHRLLVTGNQRMPSGQGLAVPKQPVGAGVRHPVDAACVCCRQLTAFRLQLGSGIVLRAPTLPYVQIPAGHIGVDDFTGIDIFQLVDTASGAAVTQALPLGRRELIQPFVFPEHARRPCGLPFPMVRFLRAHDALCITPDLPVQTSGIQHDRF